MRRTATSLIVLSALLAGGLRAEVDPVEPLEQRLNRLGGEVEQFWRTIVSVSCTETMEQRKLDPDKKNKVLNSRRAVYDYLVFLRWLGADLAVEESRELREESKRKKVRRPSHRPLLITNGFSLALLIFHPRYQSSFVFEPLPDIEQDGAVYRRIGFEHIRESTSPSALQLQDRLIPIAWKGVAWVDPESGHIARLEAALREPMEQVGLQRVSVAVEYGPDDSASSSAVWLPRHARVEAATEHQLWRNEHRFSDYRRFEVETDFRIENPIQP